MAYFDRDGDIITLDNPKAGALTRSVNLYDYVAGQDPAAMWAESAAIRTVVGAIAQDVGSVPLHVYRMDEDGNRERVRDSKLARTIAQPIPGRGQARWIEQLVLDMAIFDRWAVHIDDQGDRATLGHLPAARVAVLMDPFSVPTGVAVGIGDAEPRVLPPDAVAFDIGPSSHPRERHSGAPRLTTLAGLADELKLAATWRNSVLANGAWVPAVIERPLDAPPWDDESFERFRESFGNYRSGGGQAGGTPILEDGMKLTKADVFDPKDFDTASMRQVTLLEACLLFHYPPELIGARAGTYSNVEAFREQKWVDTLGPWLLNIEQALNAGLAGLAEPGEYIEAHVDAKLRGAFTEQAKILQSSTGRPWMTTNEARRLRNMPPIDGGDELVTPLNVVVGGLASPQDTAPDPVTDSPPKAGRPARRKASRPDDLAPEAAERKAFAAALAAYAEDQNARIRAALDRKASPADLWAVIDRDEEARRLQPIILAHIYRLAQVGAWDVLDQWDPDADGWAAENLLAYLDRAATTNAGRMAGARHGQLTDGRNIDEFDDRIAAALASVAWAGTWATTFGTEALGFGRQDAAQAAGLGNKTWRTTSGNPRPSHAAQNGETVRADDIFSNGLRWPGDHFGDADETAGCSCTVDYHP